MFQILKIGYFHADPHPGNIAIDMDGSLIYYDFGMMGEMKSFTQERLRELFYAVYEKDANKVIRCLIDLKALQPTGDLLPVRRSIQFLLDKLLIQTPDQQQTLAAIGEDLFAIATDQTLCFPSSMTFVMKAFSTLEGIGYSLDPEYSFAKIAAPYAQSERAARKASILQMSAMYTAMSGTLLNVGVTLSSQGNEAMAYGSVIGAGRRTLGCSLYRTIPWMNQGTAAMHGIDGSRKCFSIHRMSWGCGCHTWWPQSLLCK
ncbi:hypothetical protein COCNU_01G006250 [Cocos nucifera]|uniref:ABC1 atypical kinase-like domain-containing protein n=1 Tax=Cocos nucifera TaxID=13894 RepID=A0A8K0HU25_COCNU|nr:hypothetical protein COCNU_01G006250 [Cocos nucifera]